MTKGYSQEDGINTQKLPKSTEAGPRKMSHWLPRYALRLAVFAALHPAISNAAEEAWPETQPQPVSRPVLAAAPMLPESVPSQTASSDPALGAEPMSPGEGPADVPVNSTGPMTNEIDSVTIGEGGGTSNFWKPEVHAGLTVSALFDDNIFITNSDQVSDVVFVTSARMTLAFGNVQAWASRFIQTTSRALEADQEIGSDNLVALTYSPMASFFVDNDSLNTVDHDVAGTARWNFGKLKLAFDGRFQTLSDPDEDLGRRADRRITTINLAAIYDWTDKSRLQLLGNFSDRDYDEGTNSTQYDANAFVFYDLMPKTTVGVGLTAGELDLEGGGEQTFERALVRLSYNSFSKLVFSITGGGELRQSDDVEADSEFNGIFQASVAYEPKEGMEFYLSAYRRVEPSANSRAQTIERSSFSLGYNQMILQKLSLGLTADYSMAEYAAAEGSFDEGRNDDLFSFSATLTFEVTENGFVRLGYIYRQNDSSLERVSYESNQAILSATVLF